MLPHLSTCPPGDADVFGPDRSERVSCSQQLYHREKV